MHLARADIKNFRNLGKLTVQFTRGLNVVVGRNNVGKTNLFQAIRHCLGPTAALGENLWLSEDDFARRPNGTCAFDPITVSLCFEDLSLAQEAQFFEVLAVDPQNDDPSRAVVNFEATWDPQRRRVRTERWGGANSDDRPGVPQEILSALPITYLPALRDAEQALQPGRRSRLALLLRDLIERSDEEKKTTFAADIEKIFSKANEQLLGVATIASTASELSETTKKMAGIDHVQSNLQAAEPTISRVLQALRVVLCDGPVSEIHLNGLGYNNLLFMATVLTHLGESQHETPILLVEEPEAHLHPQLVQLLGDYLAASVGVPQTIVSSHSAPLAASVEPSQIVLLQKSPHGLNASSMHALGLSEREERQLKRMMDITRAALYFARGVILVEGISEELVIPALATRLGHNLRDVHVSVIPICGVSFSTFNKLLADCGLAIPVSIVTDADPPIKRGRSWKEDAPETDTDGEYQVCSRTTKVLQEFEGRPSVRVYNSQITLEFDLANAGDENPKLMAEVWQDCFSKRPLTLNPEIVAEFGDRIAKSLAVWRGICRANHTGSKAEFAHLLAERLDNGSDEFAIPEYLRHAIEYACGAERDGETE